MEFKAYGHENLLATHKNTLEFTKDRNLTKRGDCIIGINSDFKLEELKMLKGRIKIKLTADNQKDEIIAEINPEFNDSHEMVIRKSAFTDKRTFAFNANKAAIDINRSLTHRLTSPHTVLRVKITESDTDATKK